MHAWWLPACFKHVNGLWISFQVKSCCNNHETWLESQIKVVTWLFCPAHMGGCNFDLGSIFAYSVPTKRWTISETRSQSKRSKELLEGVLERFSSIKAEYPPKLHTSTEDDVVELPLTADKSETLAADVSTAETSIECRSIGIQTGKYPNLNSIIMCEVV